MMTVFETLQKQLNGRTSRKVGNNTYVHLMHDDSIALRLHATDVVRAWITPEGNHVFALDNGGYDSVVTKERMNSALRENGFVILGSTTSGWTGKAPNKYREWTLVKVPYGTGEDIEYHNGMVVFENAE